MAVHYCTLRTVEVFNGLGVLVRHAVHLALGAAEGASKADVGLVDPCGDHVHVHIRRSDVGHVHPANGTY
jgi:hypothetical protein